ncbi:unnamed protein product [Cuscuta epithymum]|uniref:DNA-directed RNA polymerase n=1 Tax=Cuscuta epithymum TaxID=186058 RepID=A0AAV0GKQ6_9ASTE|nr:unnamed protein product [Cuscuta epithymum]
MVVKTNEYIVKKAKEYQLLEDIPLKEIPINDPNIGLDIMTSVLGTKPGRQICDLGDGCLRDSGATTKIVQNLEKELEVERAVRKSTDAARIDTGQRMHNTLKMLGKSSTLLYNLGINI